MVHPSDEDLSPGLPGSWRLEGDDYGYALCGNALANNPEDAIPPREVHYLIHRIVIVSEFVS